MYNNLFSIVKNKNVIFIDYDTIMFRRVHPHQVYEQWAVCMINKFRGLYDIGKQNLLNLRNKAISACAEEYEAPSYNAIITMLYDLILDSLPEIQSINKEGFLKASHDIEYALENGCQYADKKMVKFLKWAKKENKRVYCVSNYYLSRKDLRGFLSAEDILEFIDDIFVSCELNLCKDNSGMYSELIKQFGAGNGQIIINHSLSNGKMAKFNGMDTYIIQNRMQKLKNQISKLCNFQYSKKIQKDTVLKCYSSDKPFSEYTVLFYVLTQRLNRELKKDGVQKVAFLAREGWFLRELFERYEELCVPEDEKISTAYLKCSRRAIHTVQPEKLTEEAIGNISFSDWLKAVGITREEINQFISLDSHEPDSAGRLSQLPAYIALSGNEKFKKFLDKRFKDNRSAFLRYMDSFIDNGSINIVDIGWRGTMQQGIEKVCNVPTYGYYLGIIDDSDDVYQINRKGLIFSNYKKPSAYFNILRSNSQLYEQLAAAPHGSAQRYGFSCDNTIEVFEEWAENEKLLYTATIDGLQKYMMQLNDSLCVWCQPVSDSKKQTRFLAKTVLRSALFADSKRIDFLSSLDEGFIGNFKAEVQGLQFDRMQVKINIIELLINPALYTRYFAKLQRYFIKQDNELMKKFYTPFAGILFWYIWFNQCLRRGL